MNPDTGEISDLSLFEKLGEKAIPISWDELVGLGPEKPAERNALLKTMREEAQAKAKKNNRKHFPR